MPGVAWFNALPGADATAELLRCCAAAGWASRVVAGRPYATVADLLAAAEAAWASRDPIDLDEAMAGHPPIGARRLSGWSKDEQAGVGLAATADLAAGNAAYEERFGHVFLICATGLGQAQILAALRHRMGNDPATEREVAAAEIAKINSLRLGKLVGQ